jgi:hypothetical protein
MQKRMLSLGMCVALACAGCATVATVEGLRKRYIVGIDVQMKGLGKDRSSEALVPGETYRCKLFVRCDDGKEYRVTRSELVALSSPNGTLKAEIENGVLVVKASADTFLMAMEEDYALEMRFLSGGAERLFSTHWKPDWEGIEPPSYRGEDGRDGGTFLGSLGGLFGGGASDGLDGEDGANGTDAVLNIAFYVPDDGQPFLIMYDVYREKTYCFRKWPITINAKGGDGGDGEDGDGGDDDEAASGGDGGDGGNGGRIVINHPAGMDIRSVVTVDVSGGSGGDRGTSDNGGDTGWWGSHGGGGSALFVPVSDIKSREFFPVSDQRFRLGKLTGTLP